MYNVMVPRKGIIYKQTVEWLTYVSLYIEGMYALLVFIRLGFEVMNWYGIRRKHEVYGKCVILLWGKEGVH